MYQIVGYLTLDFLGAATMPDNAAPEAETVYGALGMPFVGLVYGLNQYFSHK
jgi:hypothetical protein